MEGLVRKVLTLTLVCSAFQGLSYHVDASAQERASSWAVKAGADRMTIGSFRDSYTSRGFNSFKVEWDHMTGPGDEGGFAQAYNFPVFGIGLSYNTLSDVVFRSKNGRYADMLTLYGIISRDLVRTRHLGFGYDISLGLSYSGEYYNALTNRSNWFFSSPVLLYAAGGGHLDWAVTRRLSLEADINVRHNSSARLAYPNGGLNYWGGGMSAIYSFGGVRPPSGHVFKTQRIREDLFRKGWNFEIYAGGGVHACAAEWLAFSRSESRETVAATSLRKWPMASLSADAIYRAGGRFGLGFTADGFWNSNIERLKWADRILYDEERIEASKGYSPLSFGIGLVQEIFYRDFALYVQEGWYLVRKMGVHAEHGHIYERAGIRYYPPRLDPVFISVCIKAHRFKADYLDFTVGIKL